MTTRRQFVQSLPAFAVAANMLEGEAAPAAPAPVAPAAGHFHPKGKPPSEFTKAVLRKAKQALPFADTRDFDEQRKGLIAPLEDLTDQDRGRRRGTRDGYYGTTTRLDLPWLFNLRQDPFESYEQAPGPRATLSQQKTYLFNDIMDRLGRHRATLQKYPPKQQGSSLSIGD